jgi:hypothetical protein
VENRFQSLPFKRNLQRYNLGAHDLLKPFKPLLKFVLVKSVIFLTVGPVQVESSVHVESSCDP